MCRSLRQKARLDLRGHAQIFLQPTLLHARLKQPGGFDLGSRRVGQHGQDLEVGPPKGHPVDPGAGVEHAKHAHRLTLPGRHPQRSADHSADGLGSQSRLLAQVHVLDGIAGHHRHPSLDHLTHDGPTDPLLHRPARAIATCFQYRLLVFAEQHDGGEIGWHSLEHQIEYAIEEHREWMVHEQAGGRVRQHPHGAALRNEIGDAHGAVRGHVDAHAWCRPAYEWTERVLVTGLVHGVAAETNLTVSHRDHVVLAQGCLAEDRFAVHRYGHAVSLGDHEELILPQDDLCMTQAKAIVLEQHVALALSAQDDDTPRRPCLARTPGPFDGNGWRLS